MGTIKVSLPDDEEEEFRKAAMEKFGHKKGSLSKAAREAFLQWEEEQEHEDFSPEIIENMSGLLSHVDAESGVELEEEAYEYRAKNAFD